MRFRLVEDLSDIEEMIKEARRRHVQPSDLFNSWDTLLNAKNVFNSLTNGMESSYKSNVRKRLLLNNRNDVFYKVLLAYLDSESIGSKNYKKLDPITIKDGKPLEGKHRAYLCWVLGIPVPANEYQKESLTEIKRGASVKDDWDYWQGGGYAYKDFEPRTQKFISEHLQYTTKSLFRIEASAYSTEGNTLQVGETINVGSPKSFSRSINGTEKILQADDYDPEDFCILKTTGKIQYFDSRDIPNYSNDTFTYQEEVLCGGIFKVVDVSTLAVDENTYIVYVVKQISQPTWYVGSLVENDGVGYHYGDLGRADYRHQFGSRDTGGFGTGTYFVGKSIKDREDGKAYSKRPEHKIDLSKYNLFKPSSNSKAYELHDALLWINNHANKEVIEDNDKVWNDYDVMFSKVYPPFPDDESVPYKINKDIRLVLPFIRKYISFYNKKIPRNADFEDVMEIAKEIREEASDAGKDYRDAINKLQKGLNYSVGEQQLKSIVKKAINDTSDIAPSTLIMKALGYDGIDVRHLDHDDQGLSGLDNFGYGSVIYDL